MKNLLLTGASGFLGRNVVPILRDTYRVHSLGLSESDEYQVSLSNEIPSFTTKFDIVLHAAGKAHSVPKTASEKQEFYDINLQGTKNLCAALEKSGVPGSFIFISTVAVYGLDVGEDITEDYPLNGDSAYARSKIEAEEFLIQWCAAYDVVLSILRPSLIAGSQAPGNLGDMVRAIRAGRYISISGGRAKKSVLMVEDIAHLVPLLLEKGGTYNVCDSRHITFRDLERLIIMQLNKRLPVSVPYFVMKPLALLGDILGDKFPINSAKLNKITESLTFSNKKAREELNWEPLSVINNFQI